MKVGKRVLDRHGRNFEGYRLTVEVCSLGTSVTSISHESLVGQETSVILMEDRWTFSSQAIDDDDDGPRPFSQPPPF